MIVLTKTPLRLCCCSCRVFDNYELKYALISAIENKIVIIWKRRKKIIFNNILVGILKTTVNINTFIKQKCDTIK